MLCAHFMTTIEKKEEKKEKLFGPINPNGDIKPSNIPYEAFLTRIMVSYL